VGGMSMFFEPKDWMIADFDRFIENEFSPLARPEFRDWQEKKSAMQIWWWQETQIRAERKKIAEFRRALGSLVGCF